MQVTMQGVAWNSLGSGILFLWLSHVYTQINVAAMGGGECIYQTAKIAKNQLSEPGTGLAWPGLWAPQILDQSSVHGMGWNKPDL